MLDSLLGLVFSQRNAVIESSNRSVYKQLYHLPYSDYNNQNFFVFLSGAESFCRRTISRLCCMQLRTILACPGADGGVLFLLKHDQGWLCSSKGAGLAMYLAD